MGLFLCGSYRFNSNSTGLKPQSRKTSILAPDLDGDSGYAQSLQRALLYRVLVRLSFAGDVNYDMRSVTVSGEIMR